jgi:predicted regulator of Ras-like GTPase activity (Roadblock/LC7/MglB family)
VSLQEELGRIRAAVGETLGVFLVGTDGVIAAAAAEDGPLAWDLLAASYTDLISRIGAANLELELDPPTELFIGTPRAVLVLRRVNPDYHLLAVLDDEAHLGELRFELRKAADRVLADLES